MSDNSISETITASAAGGFVGERQATREDLFL
jgi:hypothetical protein